MRRFVASVMLTFAGGLLPVGCGGGDSESIFSDGGRGGSGATSTGGSSRGGTGGGGNRLISGGGAVAGSSASGSGGTAGTHCESGDQDADETGVDCGGADCAPCAVGEAWSLCTADRDCTGGRVCTFSSMQLAAPGRPGYCSPVCDAVAGTGCEMVPPGAEGASCLSGAGAPACVITCLAAPVCPDGFDCVFMPALFGISLCLPQVTP